MPKLIAAAVVQPDDGSGPPRRRAGPRAGRRCRGARPRRRPRGRRSRAVSLVTGPIETMRAPAGKRSPSASVRLRHGRGGGEGDVVGALGGLDRLVVGLLADGLVEGDDVDLGAALAQGVGEDVAGLGGAGDEDAARRRPRPSPAPRPAPRRRSARGRRRRAMPRSAERARGPGADRGHGRAGQGAGVEPGALPSPRRAGGPRWGWSGRPARSRRSRRPRAAPRRSRSAARSGSPAARPPRRRARAASRARPLAWARARVTTTRRPCSGRRSSQASCSRRAATSPTTISAGAFDRLALDRLGDRPQRRRRRCAGPAMCRVRSPPRARRGRARRRSAPPRSRPAV